MLASSWVVDGMSRYVEFPYGVPATMAPPFRLTYFEYIGPTGGAAVGHKVLERCPVGHLDFRLGGGVYLPQKFF
jgi:hypothetical protein